MHFNENAPASMGGLVQVDCGYVCRGEKKAGGTLYREPRRGVAEGWQ